ncbi:hypothetical protein [Amycolatopsis magusensis]|uniref:hypothetical protein n=1 Tax=Amycolatopsis magusensis TaxID=882444 RepID=UPI0037A8D7CF
MTSGANFDTQSQAEKQGGAPPPGPPPAAGDAGNSFLSNMLSGLDPMDAESVKQFNADVQKIKDLAGAGPANGGFAIEPESGQKYIDAIGRYLDGAWPNLSWGIDSLKQHPALGDGNYATAVAKFDAGVMDDGGPKSLIPNLHSLSDGLLALKEAIGVAMASYNKEDEESSLVFKAVDAG